MYNKNEAILNTVYVIVWLLIIQNNVNDSWLMETQAAARAGICTIWSPTSKRLLTQYVLLSQPLNKTIFCMVFMKQNNKFFQSF